MAVLRKAPSKALTAYLRSHKRLQQRNGKRTQIFKHSLGLSCTAKTSINTVVYTCLHACTCTILGHVLKHTAWSKLCSVDPRNDRTHFSSLNNDECRPGGSECDYYSISRLEAFALPNIMKLAGCRVSGSSAASGLRTVWPGL